MQLSAPLRKKRLEKKLKKYLNKPQIADIFLYGSSFKDKIEPRDIDVAILFRAKEFEMVEEILFQIKKEVSLEKLHLEPLYLEDILTGGVFSSLIHEGFSLRHGRKVGEMLGYNSYWLFTYRLDNLNNVEKVRFSQTLYGRKGAGLLQESGGRALGKGVFLAPVEKEHLFREVLARFKVGHKSLRVLVKD